MSPDYRRTPTQRLRRQQVPQCTAGDLRHALRVLGWSQAQAAVELGASSEYTVSDWARGARRVPMYIQRHLRTLLGLGPTDPWPSPKPKDHPVRLPPSLGGHPSPPSGPDGRRHRSEEHDL